MDYNLANLGYVTTGNGIELVEVRNAAASAPGAFVLGNRVMSGAYEYTLFHGGVGADAADGNWYLRSALRQEVPLNMAVPALTHRLGLVTLGTYHDRAGEDYMMSADGGVMQGYRHEDGEEDRAWGRVFGFTGKAGDGSLEDPRHEFDLGGIQLGADVYRSLNEKGARNIAGGFFIVSRARALVDDLQGVRAGKVTMNGYSLGGYWTHIAPKRWYVDAVAQVTWLDRVEARSDKGETIRPDGWGWSASLEAGYPFQLNEQWSFEPQVQLIYQHMSLGTTRDRGSRIDFGDSEAWYGRLGARLVRNWETDGGREHALWGRLNVWHDFNGKADTTFANPDGRYGVTLETPLGGRWAQLGVGYNTQLRDNMNAFIALDYEHSLERSHAHGFSGRIGLQFVW